MLITSRSRSGPANAQLDTWGTGRSTTARSSPAGDHRRGFRAHLGALRDGEITSGAVKLFGICAAGLVAGALMKERPVDKVEQRRFVGAHANLVDWAKRVSVEPSKLNGAVMALDPKIVVP